MPRVTRAAGPQSPRSLVLLACALIAATAVAALLVMVVTARAQTSGSLVCPHDDRSQSAPTQIRTGARKELVPPGATTLTVCRYNGMNAFGGVPQWGLRGAGATDKRSQINKIIAGLDALKPTRGVYNCPFSDSSDVVATFGYGSGPGVVITMDTGDCNTVSNGHVRRLGLGKPIVAQIESLAKPVTGQSWASVRGHLRLCGGPAPGRCWTSGFGICAPHCMSANRVVADNSKGLWIAMAPVSKGRFHFTVASPGTDEFYLYADNRMLVKTRARVIAGRTITVVFTLAVP